MSHWDAIEEKTKSIITADLLEATAYRLVSEQVLYAADIKSRTSYSLVEQYERDFSHAKTPEMRAGLGQASKHRGRHGLQYGVG